MILKDIPAIYTSAMIGALNISVWEGRKKDKGIEQDVADRAGARSKNATSVTRISSSIAPRWKPSSPCVVRRASGSTSTLVSGMTTVGG